MRTNEARVPPTTLNGLEIPALQAAVEGIAADPNLGMVTFRAKTSWQGRLKSRTDISSYRIAGQDVLRTHRIETDEPLEIMGENTAPNPQDLLLAAVASCMSVGFVVNASVAGITIDSLEIDTECTLDMRGAFGIDESIPAGARFVKYTIRVKGDGTREQYEQIHQEVVRKSPNYYHLANPIPFHSELVVV
jgi:uncharacterized OsmC-like protein